MHVHHLSDTDSALHQYLAEIRDVAVHGDRLRFRRNIERIGEVMAYEISKALPYAAAEVTTPVFQQLLDDMFQHTRTARQF